MKNDLIVVKNNWELSGNGDGCVARDSTEFDGIINGNDKRKFLNGVSSVCLYLWEKAPPILFSTDFQYIFNYD